MNKSSLRITGLLAFAAAFAAPMAFAQDAAATADQAQAAQSQPATPTDAADPGKKTWADLDTNKDGNLDKSEAASIPSLSSVFDQADANADGSLTGDEYKTYLAANGDKSQPGQ